MTTPITPATTAVEAISVPRAISPVPATVMPTAISTPTAIIVGFLRERLNGDGTRYGRRRHGCTRYEQTSEYRNCKRYLPHYFLQQPVDTVGILTCAIEGSLRLQKFIPRALQNAEWLFIGAATVRGCRASANSSRIQCKLCCITAIRMKRHIAIGNAAVGTGMIMRASGDARVSASATRPSYSYYHSHRY